MIIITPFSASCSTGECIPSWQLCDGKCDCTDKRPEVCEDESKVYTCVAAQFDGYLESASKALFVQMGLVILMALVCLIIFFLL